MSEQAFDAFTRRAADSVTRRGSLATLGGAGLAALLGGSLTAVAKKKNNNKKDKKKDKKKAKQQCQKQVDECDTSVQIFCAQFNGEASGCLTALQPCCLLMTDCNIGAGVTCLTQFIT